MIKKILVTGASGLVGKNLIRKALGEGLEVVALVRNPQNFNMLPESHVYAWNHTEEPPTKAFAGVDAIFHLAGANIADRRWTAAQKKNIVDSRLIGTKNLVATLSKLPEASRPQVLVSSSAVGFYGYSRQEPLDENASAGSDFLAQLCVKWEKEALSASSLGLRVVLARTGIVLAREGGALAQMPPVQIGNGQNWMSWIQIDDMVNALLFAAKTQNLQGAVNFVSPSAVQNKQFIRTMTQQLKVPNIAAVPKMFLRLGLGEMAEVLYSSLNVRPTKLLNAGFKFECENLQQALQKEWGENGPLDQYVFKDQFVPLKPEEVFPFFSKAENLEILTPPWLQFKIVKKSTKDIEVGTLIDYKLKIHGTPVRWRTLIKDWKNNEFFIDEQLKGPYSKWHHVHKFERVPGGCLLRDEITYKVPVSFLGKIFLSRWIAKDVEQIFSYRQKQIQELYKSGRLVEK